MPPIRRLPVLQNADTSDDDRPAWHWIVIGIAFVFSIWVPLAMLANWVGGRAMARAFGDLPPEEIANRLGAAAGSTRFGLWLAVTVLPGVAFAASSWAAGALVGRFGSKAGAKEAAIAGALSALFAALLTLTVTSWVAALSGLAILLPLGTGAAFLGARFGLRRRAASVTRAPPPPGGKATV